MGGDVEGNPDQGVSLTLSFEWVKFNGTWETT